MRSQHEVQLEETAAADHLTLRTPSLHVVSHEAAQLSSGPDVTNV